LHYIIRVMVFPRLKQLSQQIMGIFAICTESINARPWLSDGPSLSDFYNAVNGSQAGTPLLPNVANIVSVIIDKSTIPTQN